MIQGASVTIKMSGETVMVNNATVTSADIAASNGVMHVVDTLLVPSAN